MRLSVVVVTDTRPETIEVSLTALAASVEVAEQAGVDVEVVVVNTSRDPVVREFLHGVDGVRLLQRPGVPRAAALLAGAEQATGGLLWLGGTESAPVPGALLCLHQAPREGVDVVLPSATDPAPYAVVPAGSTATMRSLCAAGPADLDLVPALVERLVAEGSLPVGVEGAGMLRSRVREPRALTPLTTVHPGQLVVGPATYAGATTVVATYGPHDRIELGGYCSIANDVRIILPGGRAFDVVSGEEVPVSSRGIHRTGSASTFPIGVLVPEEPYEEPPPGTRGERLEIGDDVWIGYGASIMGNVSVGTGSVVGAGAVVVKDVPPYTVVGGVPARPIRRRFDDRTVDRLLAVAWWNWPLPLVKGAHRWFAEPVAVFLRHFDPAGELGTSIAG